MKFPLSERPFAAASRLNAQQSSELKRVAHRLLEQTVHEYEDFTRVSAGQLSKKRWKSIKHREALTVYRERIDKDDFAPPPVGAIDLGLPKLLMVGTIVGTLDDVMYGTIAPTSEAMRIRSAYVGDEILDCQLLDEIQMPTPERPFQFVGLQWAVRSHSSALNPMAWPRDIVVLEATGILTRPHGERLGYRVVHSVHVPQYHELDQLGIVRTRMSSTALFKQLPNGTVDVYTTRFTEPSGKMPDSVTLTAAATSMLSCWRSVWCSQNKKLACAAKDGAQRWAAQGGAAKLERLVVTTDEDGKYCCGLCLKGYKLYSSVITCQACNLMVCSRCQVGRRLAHIGYKEQITQYPVLFCKNCITRSTKESAWDVARTECGFAPVARSSSPPHQRRGGRDSKTSKKRLPVTPMNPNSSISTEDSSTFSGSLHGLEPSSYSGSHAENGDDGDVDSAGRVDIQTADDWDCVHDSSCYMEQLPEILASDSSEITSYANTQQAKPSQSLSGGDDPQQRLWMKMTQLCMAAEKTYNIAKKNADVMRQQQQMTLH